MKPKEIELFEEMLRQMSPHFTISEIVSVLFVARSAFDLAYLLHMQNGEYWFVSRAPWKRFELFKFPPPIPAMDQFPWPSKNAIQLRWKPDDLNEYLKTNGCSETMYLPDHDREETR